MVVQKRNSQKATSKPKSARTKGSPRPPSATAAGRFALLLEEMDHRNKAVIEAVFSTRDELRRELNAKFDTLSERVSSLELAVKDSSARLGALEARVQSHDAKLDEHSKRLARIETKLDDKADKADILMLAQRLSPLERAAAS